jgi:hypothetical protein
MEKKKLKITFAPDAFENFDGTQEELDEFVAGLEEWLTASEIYDDDNGEVQEVFVHAVGLDDVTEQEIQYHSKRLH